MRWPCFEMRYDNRRRNFNKSGKSSEINMKKSGVDCRRSWRKSGPRTLRLTNLVRVSSLPRAVASEATPSITEAEPAKTRNCKFCGGDHYITSYTKVTCTDCNEYGHTAYVCPKKSKPPPAAKSRATKGSSGWTWKPKESVRQVAFDVTRIKVEELGKERLEAIEESI